MTLLDRLQTWAYHLVNRNDADAIEVATQGLHEYISGLEARLAALESKNGTSAENRITSAPGPIGG